MTKKQKNKPKKTRGCKNNAGAAKKREESKAGVVDFSFKVHQQR